MCGVRSYYYYLLLSLLLLFFNTYPWFFQEEIADARRKRKLNILFLGMTRVAEYDCIGGLTKGKKRFDIVEKRVRQDVDETNMNPLRL